MRLSKIRFASVSASLLLAAAPARADGTIVTRPKDAGGAPYGYLEFVPPSYTGGTDQKPLVVVLHGIGEQGSGSQQDLEAKAANNGPGGKWGNDMTAFTTADAIVLIPQSPTWWDAALIRDFMVHALKTYRVDPRRAYLTGLSMGGGGTWDAGKAYADRFAALIPICGASTTKKGDGPAFLTTPVWAFHNFDDPTVTRNNTIGFANEIAAALLGAPAPDVMSTYPHEGGDTSKPAAEILTAQWKGSEWSWVPGADKSGSSPFRFTLRPDGGHNAWSKTFDAADTWTWLFSQKRALPAPLVEGAIIVDNLEPGATFEGSWQQEYADADLWSFNFTAGSGEGVSASFTTTLPTPGSWEVFVNVVPGADRAVVDVAVETASGAKTTTLDMKTKGGFQSAGVFDLGTNPKVTLSAAGGKIIADAVAFQKAETPLPGDGGTDGGSGGGNGAGGSGGSSGEGGNATGGNPVDDSGCAFMTVGSSSRGGGATALLLAGAAVLFLHRARRRN